MASNKEKIRLVPLRKDLDRRTNGARRRLEGICKAPDVLVEIVAEACRKVPHQRSSGSFVLCRATSGNALVDEEGRWRVL